jgi:hypothetical protein
MELGSHLLSLTNKKSRLLGGACTFCCSAANLVTALVNTVSGADSLVFTDLEAYYLSAAVFQLSVLAPSQYLLLALQIPKAQAQFILQPQN